MDFPGWNELSGAVLPASLGAAIALSALIALKAGLRRLRRKQGLGAGIPELDSLRIEAQRIEVGLRALATEIEGRLDSRIDRLESTLREAKSRAEEGPLPGKPPAGGARPRWDPLAALDAADQNRVLQLAELGKLPDAIAESVGLLRGEVDLILRLHKQSGRAEGRP